MNSLQAVELGKTFPGVVALDSVSLTVQAGTIHALVGANGAGKSTLIKILTGYYADYRGKILLDEQEISVRRPADALHHGIEVVHQEVDTALVPSLSVAENLLIEQLADPKSSIVLNWPQLRAEAQRIAERINLQLDLSRPLETLSLHQKQLVLIARAVSRNVRYLILDEPTASLSLREVERLFAVVRDLAAQGIGVIYISHRLAEVGALADEITVLRSGRQVAHLPRGTDPSQIIEAMLGVAPTDLFPPRREVQAGEVLLEAQALSRGKHVQQVDLTVRRGEIVGIAGLVGAGKTELLRLLFGADRAEAGAIRVAGQVVRFRQPRDAVRQGLHLVPEERRSQGLHVDHSVRENLSLPFLQALSGWFGWLRRVQEGQYANALVTRVALTPPRADVRVGTLSGGNQQKVVVGKWLGQPPRVLLFDEATQGIDVRAKREIYQLVQEASATAAVVYASSDIDEVLGLADRVLVMRDGRLVAELDAATADRQAVLAYATGTDQETNNDNPRPRA